MENEQTPPPWHEPDPARRPLEPEGRGRDEPVTLSERRLMKALCDIDLIAEPGSEIERIARESLGLPLRPAEQSPAKAQVLVVTPLRWSVPEWYGPDGLTTITLRIEITGRVERGSLDLTRAVEDAVGGWLRGGA